MKARPFLAAVLTAAVVLVGLALGGWWGLWHRSPVALQHQALTLPLAARFVPRNAPLSLHWLVGPDQPAAYARAVAPPRQRRAAAAAADRLRDGAFAAAGLDYPSELAPWLGSEASLALLTPPGQGDDPGWVLALRSRDSSGARQFLQRFWQTRSLAGTDLQISRYRGMGLISGRGALVGQESQPLATALIDDDLVLIASGRGVLEQALDVSQIDDLNQAASPLLRQAMDRLGDGVALLTARPAAMEAWLGIPAGDGAATPALELVAALTPAGRGLAVDALVQLRDPLPPLRLRGAEGLVRQVHAPATSLALLQDPAALLAAPPAAVGAEAVGAEAGAAGVANPWQLLLSPLLQRALATEQGPLPALVAAADHGPLLWGHQREGWLLGTSATDPDPVPLQVALAADGFSAGPLARQGQTLQAWTRLQSGLIRGHPDQLGVELAGVRSEEGSLAWWAQGLTLLGQQQDGRDTPRERLDQLASLGSPEAPVQWAMDAPTARDLLGSWQPWRLLTTLSSTRLAEVVQGLALGLEADDAPGPAQGALRLRASLDLG